MSSHLYLKGIDPSSGVDVEIDILDPTNGANDFAGAAGNGLDLKRTNSGSKVIGINGIPILNALSTDLTLNTPQENQALVYGSVPTAHGIVPAWYYRYFPNLYAVHVQNTTGSTISGSSFVNVYQDVDGNVFMRLADLSSGTNHPAHGVVVADVANNAYANVYFGSVLSGFRNGAGSPLAQAGKFYWLDPTNPGKFTATYPTASGCKHQIVGIGYGPYEMYIMPQIPTEDLGISGGGGGGSFTAGGDLSGTSSSQTVIGLQGRSVSSTAPTDGQVLTWDNTSSIWKPVTPSSGGGGSFTAGGDLSGTSSSQTVIAAQGHAISNTAPSTNQIFMWSGSAWTPTSIGGDVSGPYSSLSVDKIKGRAIATTAPTNGQVLTWNNGSSQWEPQTPSSGSFTAGGDLSGTSSSQTVTGLQTKPVSTTAPTSGQVLTYNGTQWAAATPASPTGVPHGSSFPTSVQPDGTLYQNDTIKRLGIYNSATQEWWSAEQREEIISGAPGLTGKLNLALPMEDYPIRLEKIKYRGQVQTTNDGSNYWQYQLQDNASGTYHSARSTSAWSPDTQTSDNLTTFSTNPIPDTVNEFFIQATKTGSPGNLALVARMLYRLVYATISSTFSPTSISNLVAWFDASQITGLSNGSGVTSWSDLSGNSNNTSAVVGSSPTYQTSVQNGLGIVRFSGSNGFNVANPSNFNLSTFSIYGVTKGTGTFCGKNDFGTGGQSRRKLQLLNGGTTFASGNDSNAINYTASSVNTSVFNMFRVIWRGTNDQSYQVNGTDQNITSVTQDATTYNSNSFNLGMAAPGGIETFTGDIGELIVYGRNLNSTEDADVISYLRTKWSV